VEFLPRPKGAAKLPGNIVQLSGDIGREDGEATRNGMAGGDDSHGHALSEYPPARALQLKLREYARTHSTILIEVLEKCADDRQRAIAAEALGYTALRRTG
jgi:hypothetical protein